MTRGYFVTGTDTGVGKTLVSAALIHGFVARGFKTAGVKPVASGCEVIEGQCISADAAQLRAAANVALLPEVSNPYAFAPPLAPHIAAHRVGVEIAFSRIAQACQAAASVADMLVVEGVGGFRVPLSAQGDTADLALALGLPVILVIGMRLGCLNHALLTAEAIHARGLPLAGWVANSLDPAMSAMEENLQALRLRLAAPCLGALPLLASADFRVAAHYLDVDSLLSLVP